jgi:hypothetical protein
MAAINHPFGPARRGLPLPRPFGGINWWIVMAVLLAAFSAMLPVIQNSAATSRGFDIQASQARQAKLSGEVNLLESDVARLTSLARIERRASEIGLAPAANPIYVTVSEPGPQPAKIPAELLPARDALRDAPAPWWRSLLNWLRLP